MRADSYRVPVILVACVAITVLVPVITWSSLPHSVAIQWAVSTGRPNGSLARLPAAILLIVVPLVFAALTAAAARSALMPMMRAGLAAAGVMVTALTAMRAAFTLAENAAYGARVQVHALAAVWSTVAIVLIALVAAWFTGQGSGGTSSPPWRTSARAPLWRGSASARWPIPTTVVMFAVGFGALFIANDVFGLIFGLGFMTGGIFVLSLAAIVVEIDQRELRVHYFGGAAWPATHIPLADIQGIEVVDIVPQKSGGWGYRGSLRLQGYAAVILRRGPGLRLTLTRNRRFLVTVDDPDGGAQVLRQVVMTP